MVWFENAIYQKSPMSDQWVFQDLTEMKDLFNFDDLMQMTPQQSIELMNKAGVINVFGEDVEKDGREYFTIKNYIDADSFRSLMEEVLGKIDLASFMAAFGAQSEGAEDIGAQFEKVIEVILNNMAIDYYVDTLIDKETLLSDYMSIDLNMEIDVKQLIDAMAEMSEIDEDEKAEIPEGPMNLRLKMKGDYQLSDYGVELELPDLSNAISQEEYIQQLMEKMEEVEESKDLMEQETAEDKDTTESETIEE